MDWNRVEVKWKQMKGRVKEQWGKLTDDDLDVMDRRGRAPGRAKIFMKEALLRGVALNVHAPRQFSICSSANGLREHLSKTSDAAKDANQVPA